MMIGIGIPSSQRRIPRPIIKPSARRPNRPRCHLNEQQRTTFLFGSVMVGARILGRKVPCACGGSPGPAVYLDVSDLARRRASTNNQKITLSTRAPPVAVILEMNLAEPLSFPPVEKIDWLTSALLKGNCASDFEEAAHVHSRQQVFFQIELPAPTEQDPERGRCPPGASWR